MSKCWKDQYETKADALAGARTAGSRYGKHMHVYNCEECEAWHLSSMSSKEFRNRDYTGGKKFKKTNVRRKKK